MEEVLTQKEVNDKLSRAAQDYAEEGVPVFPLQPKSKVPYPNTHGHKDATTNRDTAESRWIGYPGSNIGIATGEASGILVLDIDGPAGEQSLKELEKQHGPLPKTKTAITGKGGHYYFKNPKNCEIRNSAGAIGKSIDVRGEGGYVVAPPSIHPNGHEYAWEDPNANIADLPAPYIQLLQNKKGGVDKNWKKAPGSHLHAVTPPNGSCGFQAGTRNDSIFRSALANAKAGVPSEKVREQAIKQAQECNPPLPIKEASRCAEQAINYCSQDKATFQACLEKWKSTDYPQDQHEALVQALFFIAGQPKLIQERYLHDLKTATKIKIDQLRKTLAEIQASVLGQMPTGRFFRPMPYVNRLKSKYHLFTNNGQLFKWNSDKGHYQPWDSLNSPTENIYTILSDWMGEDARTSHIREVADLLFMNSAVDPESVNPPDLIGLQNGVLDIRTGKQCKPNPDIRITAVLAVSFDENAKCPMIDKFIDHAFPDPQQQRHFEEIGGYTIAFDTSKQTAFLWIDPNLGRTGKSTASLLILRTIGPGLYSSLSLNELSSSKYKIAETANKLANLSQEVGANNYLNDSRLKQYISAEPFSVERKFEHPFNMTPTARLIVTANSFPMSHDRGAPFLRRWQLLTFENQFPAPGEKGHIPNFAQQLSQEEINALFLRFLEGRIRLQEQGCFTVPESSRKAISDYQRALNPLFEFVEDRLEVSEGGRGTPAKSVYKEYKEWVQDNSMKPMKFSNFRKEILSALGIAGEPKDSHTKAHIIPGVAIRPNLDSENTEWFAGK